PALGVHRGHRALGEVVEPADDRGPPLVDGPVDGSGFLPDGGGGLPDVLDDDVLVPGLGSRRASNTAGAMRSTTSRRYPEGVECESTALMAAPTAPHEVWPSTSVSGIESTSTPNSIDPSTDGSTMWPALRITKRSPRTWSKTTSAGTRESEQPNTWANGFWWPASSARRSGSWCSCRL